MTSIIRSQKAETTGGNQIMNHSNIDPENSMSRSSLRLGLVLIPLVVACLALSPAAQAQLSPAPDGGYANNNTAEGTDALFSVAANGIDNTALGFDALYNTTSGTYNTATGSQALYSNTTGNYNTANGFQALYSNTTGHENTATGDYALFSNTTGTENTAMGVDALNLNTTGDHNTAIGYNALDSNMTGGYNAAEGFIALYSNTTGNYNTANGLAALYSNTTGGSNTASGVNALYSNTTGSSNIALGNGAGLNLTTGSNNIDIGNDGVAAESNTIRIGGTQTNAFMAGIYNATVVKGVGVVVDSTGHLGTKGSSARFKEAIKPMDKASEAILALKPVTFHYKKELDPEAIPQFGLVAEQVEKVNPDLVARDEQGKPYTVRYEAVNAMLLNEFLKEHSHVQEQDAIIARQQKQIEALTTGLQKVSAELELSKPAPLTVNNQ